MRICKLAIAFFISLSVLESQETKLRVASPDSVLSRFTQCGFITGTVFVEGTYTELQGASVTMSDQPVDSATDSQGLIVTHQTDGVGSFSFDLITEGQYYLQVECPGYFPHTESVWIRSQDLATIRVDLVPDYSHPLVHQTGSIQFEISDRSTGEPVDGAVIDVAELRQPVDVDISGIRYLHLLMPARYHFSVVADGYRESPEESVVVVAGTCVPVAVRLRGSVVTLEDLLCPEDHRKPYPVSMIDPASFCTITGSLIDDYDGQHIAFEQVYLAPYGNVVETDSTGTFTFLGLRPGIYCATVRVPGFHRTTEHEIELAPGKTLRVNLFLRRLTAGGND